ncbi:MAG: HAD family hydrolase [Thermostichus sp. BF3_bins_97]
MQLQALIFDVDGTLADTERDGHRVAFNAAFAEAGLDWQWSVELYGQLLAVTGGKERIRHFIDIAQPPLPPTDDLIGLIAQLHKAKTRHYTALLAQGGIPLRTGVKRFLQEAKTAGIRLAIATTTTPENVTALLEHTLPESLQWFEVIAAGDIVPAKKPAPDIYHYTLETMGLEPQDCLAFEDSHNGLLSAQQAGLPTVVTVNEYTQAQEFSGAALVLDHLGEPGDPFRVLGGTAGSHSHFTLELAQQVHAQSFNPNSKSVS